MKTCNSSREIFSNHPHQPQQEIISNVPTRLKRDSSSAEPPSSLSSSLTKRQKRCTTSISRKNCRIDQHSNHHAKTFGFRILPVIIQSIILLLTLSWTLHLTTGSHLPTSYLVQKANSNHEYNIIVGNANSEEAEPSLQPEPSTVSSTTANVDSSTTSPSTTKIPEDVSTTTIVTPDAEPRPEFGNVVEKLLSSGLADTAYSTIVPPSSSSSSQESSSTETLTPTTPSPSTDPPKLSILASSYEDSNDSNLNYISEHDHYDEYAAMKAVLEKERSSEDEADKPTEPSPAKSERKPYYLQAADGRKYASIEALCDDRQVTITGHFEDVFKGRIYALGYSDENECGTSNAKEHSQNITFSLQLGSCGVQMLAVDDNLENDLRHEVTLYIQYSAFLQQIVDEKISVSCTETKRSPVDEYLASEEIVTSNRQGRRMGSLVGETGKFGTTKISSRIGESWMEILAGKDPSPKSRKLSPVAVGEDVTLVISTKVIRGYDARIVNCSAHDGSKAGTIDGSRAQQILDSAGCSLDRSLVPNLRRRRLPIESRNRLITLHFASFPAFKFPERDHLHIKCAVAYCQGPCPQEPCDSVLNHFGSWRDKYGRIADVLLDSTEVVNSVEVVAPELDDLGRSGQHYERQSPTSAGTYSSLSNGNNVSPASPSEISARQFPSDQHPTSSYSLYASRSGEGSPSAAPSAAASAGHSMYSNSQPPPSSHQMNPETMHGPVGNSVCVSPGTVILALVILGVVLVISATATLWFALKRSEAKKYRHLKHSPFQHAPQPYYRFSHW